MIPYRECLSVLILCCVVNVCAGQGLFDDDPAPKPVVVAESDGPLKDVTYEIIWLIESDDENRKEYAGKARQRLTEVGFGRLVHAGRVQSAVTIGRESMTSGQSRYGPMSVTVSMLNTTEADQVQAKLDLRTKSNSPISVNTTVRVPLGRWVLLMAANSTVGLPLHQADGNRSVLIMRITDGALLLD